MSRKKKGNRWPHPMYGPSGGAPAPTRQLVLQTAYAEKWRVFLMKLALGRFEWINLPDSVSPRFLEKTLLMQSRGIFFIGRNEDSLEEELLATPVIPQGPPDLYDNWNSYKAQGGNGRIMPIPDGEGVMIYDSMSRFSVWNTIEIAVNELTQVDMQQMANLRQQRELGMVSVPESSKQDATRVLTALEMNDEYIVVEEEFEKTVKPGIFMTGADYKQDKFHEDRTAKLNGIYLQLGIDHVPFEKQAHMLETETEKSTDAVMRVRDDLLNARLEAIEEVNRRWGTKISVEWNSGDETESTEEERKDG